MKVLTIPYFPFRRYEPIDALTEFQTVGLASWRDWWAKYVDIFGGRARVYERPTMSAIQDATSRMKREAMDLGADASHRVFDFRVSVEFKGDGDVSGSRLRHGSTISIRAGVQRDVASH